MASYTLTFLLFLLSSPLLANVSLAALTGVMITVCFQTVQWDVMRDLVRGPFTDESKISVVTLIITSIACYELDFGSGCIIGVFTEQGLKSLTKKSA